MQSNSVDFGTAVIGFPHRCGNSCVCCHRLTVYSDIQQGMYTVFGWMWLTKVHVNIWAQPLLQIQSGQQNKKSLSFRRTHCIWLSSVRLYTGYALEVVQCIIQIYSCHWIFWFHGFDKNTILSVIWKFLCYRQLFYTPGDVWCKEKTYTKQYITDRSCFPVFSISQSISKKFFSF